ncbi:hypothetical protein ACH4PR_54355 [Streptomyces mirabilis]|uniref:hypothetical protein n=1 Tax=Streptomyces mirabilis TaxID=68239 RepID=UPI003791A592
MTDVTDRIGNVTRQRYEQLVTQAKELIAQVARAQFALGDSILRRPQVLRRRVGQRGGAEGEVAGPGPA